MLVLSQDVTMTGDGCEGSRKRFACFFVGGLKPKPLEFWWDNAAVVNIGC